MIYTETLPTSWDADRDPAFFKITTALFDSAFTAGAGVLLASYDGEQSPRPLAATAAEFRRDLAARAGLGAASS